MQIKNQKGKGYHLRGEHVCAMVNVWQIREHIFRNQFSPSALLLLCGLPAESPVSDSHTFVASWDCSLESPHPT